VIERLAVVNPFDLVNACLDGLVLAEKIIVDLVGVLVAVETDKAGDLGGRDFGDHFG
jgi:hypothetical protein